MYCPDRDTDFNYLREYSAMELCKEGIKGQNWCAKEFSVTYKKVIRTRVESRIQTFVRTTIPLLSCIDMRRQFLYFESLTEAPL